MLPLPATQVLVNAGNLIVHSQLADDTGVALEAAEELGETRRILLLQTQEVLLEARGLYARSLLKAHDVAQLPLNRLSFCFQAMCLLFEAVKAIQSSLARSSQIFVDLGELLQSLLHLHRECLLSAIKEAELFQQRPQVDLRPGLCGAHARRLRDFVGCFRDPGWRGLRHLLLQLFELRSQLLQREVNAPLALVQEIRDFRAQRHRRLLYGNSHVSQDLLRETFQLVRETFLAKVQHIVPGACWLVVALLLLRC
mmetsp:Transcript_7160/g.16957  ORF Transcript_7160/g.16957 Transcript_7160/m.16957 type:complete len:254 (-) Transcript_7160:97-858(-)